MQGCFAGQARIVGLAGKPVLSTQEGNVSRGGAVILRKVWVRSQLLDLTVGHFLFLFLLNLILL